MSKPEIIVLSSDDDQDGFKWLSNGWAKAKTAEALFAKAKECIAKGDNVKEVIQLLKKAGFKVTRDQVSHEKAQARGR